MSDETILLEQTSQPLGRNFSVEVIRGPHKGFRREYAIECDIVIGREKPATIRLPSEHSLSRQHFVLEFRHDRIQFKDLNSRNGVRLNDVLAKSGSLIPGDLLSVGETVIRISEVGPDHSSSPGQQTNRSAPVVPKPSAVSTSQACRELTPTITPSQSRKVEANARVYEAERELPLQTLSQASPSNIDASDVTTEFVALNTNIAAKSKQQYIGSYELIRVLGSGGMATVYEGRHQKTGISRAIKLLHIEEQFAPKMTGLFAREASLLLKLDHPRIVRAFEFGLHQNVPYLVMELVKTTPLEKLVDEMAPDKKIRLVCGVMTRVLDALQYAHDQGIVHRDIKPSNILAYVVNKRLLIKLADFGLAKYYEDSGTNSLTQEYSLRGTLAYMAPEQFTSAKNAEPSTDIFAAGACLFRLLTGELPKNSLQHSVPCERIKELNFLPETLKQVILQATNTDQNQRFSSAEAFAQALKFFTQK